MRKYPSRDDVIKAARAMGSTATTFRGARKYMLNRTHSIFPALIPGQTIYPRRHKLEAPYGSRDNYRQRDHKIRLCRRYVGMRRLPAYLSDQDRQTIAAHPAVAELGRLAAMPVFARALYMPAASSVRNMPRLAAFVRAADRNRGVLTEWASIADDAHAHCDFGRTRRNHTGKSCLSPGIRIESYERGYAPWGKKWVHHDYYSDYTLITPARSTRGRYYRMYYVRPNGEVLSVAVSPHFYRIGSGVVTPRILKAAAAAQMPVHTQRRILDMATRAPLTTGYDRDAKKLFLADGHGERYHLPEITAASQARELVREAVQALRKRRAEKISISDPGRVWVCVEDSYESGNCRTMTDKFAQDFIAQIGADGPVCARGDLVLSIRDDIFTRRAISYAAARS